MINEKIFTAMIRYQKNYDKNKCIYGDILLLFFNIF